MLTLQRRGIVDEYRQFSFSRASTAFDSRGRLYHPHNARFEPGKFGQAVLIETGTTINILPAGAETFQGGGTWQTATGNGAPVITPGQPDPWGGNTAVRIRVPQGTGTGAMYELSLGYKTGTFTNSVWAKVNNGEAYLKMSSYGPGSKIGSAWSRVTRRETLNNLICHFGFVSPSGDLDITVCFPQCEARDYATFYTPPGTTRTSETLTVPTVGLLDPREGTIELWINPLVIRNYNNFFNMIISTGRFLLFFEDTRRVRWDFGAANDSINSDTGVAVDGQWLHVAMRWSASKGTRELFVNGQLIGSKPFTPPDSFPTTVNVVNNYSAMIDDLRISNIARSDAEIAAAYASGQPLQTDQYTTLLLNFDGPDAQRAAKTVVI